MRRRRLLRVPSPSRDERGTSLVLALAFITLFGVGAGVLAQFGAVSFQTVKSVRDQRAAVYAAQGAVDTAIDFVRGNSSLGTNGGSCPTLSFPAAAGHAINATCAGQAPAGGGGGSGASFPSQALLTMATGSEDGITVGSTLPGNVKIGGPVFSNSGINANSIFNQGGIDSGNYPLIARGSCQGNITGKDAQCDVGPGGHPEGNDPNYPSPLSVIPARQNVPPCPAATNKIITFSPGFYDDEASLTNLTNGGCKNAVLWFQPGAYYFDFDLANYGTGNVWFIADPSINIVGGTPKGWSTTSATRPVIPSPGACKVDTDPAPNTGVQFVWGGDSQWLFAAGNTELCASPDGNGRELVLYGQKTGNATPTTTTYKPTAFTPTAGWASPLSPSNALNAIDNVVTTANLSGAGKTASMTFNGYGTNAIPAGSVITSVQLRVAHRESSPTSVNTLTATVNGNGANCSIPITARTTLGTDPLYNVSCITTAAQLSTLNVVYAGKLNSSGSPASALDLDGLEVVVNYTAPALRAQSGCILLPGGILGGNGACSFVALTSIFGGGFYLNGTVYAPLARLDLELTFATKVQATRGIIVRAIALYDPPSISTISTNISVPPSVRSVVFIGQVDGVRRVRAVVNYTDTPTAGSQAVVSNWAVSR